MKEGDRLALSGTVTPEIRVDKSGAPRPIVEMVALAVDRPGEPFYENSTGASTVPVTQRDSRLAGAYDSMF